MKPLRSVHRVVLAGALAMAVVACGLATAHGGETVVLARVCARDLKALGDKVVKFAQKLAPEAGAGAAAQIASILESPKWVGSDWSKPATVIVLGGKAFGKTEPVAVVVVPVADAEKFRAARKVPEGAPTHFEIRDQFAIVSDEQAALAAITPRRLALYGQFPKIGGSTDVYLTIYIAEAIQEYQAEIDAQILEAQKKMAEVQMPGPMAVAGKMVKIAGPLAKLAGTQFRRASLMMQLNDDSVEIAGRLYPMEDSQLGTLFTGQPAEPGDLAKYVPADVVFGMTGKLDMAKAKPLAEAVLAAIAGPLELPADEQQKIRDLMFASTQTGEFAVGVAGAAANQGIQTVQVARIADAAKFREAAKSGLDWFTSSGLGNMMQGMGLKMTVEHKPAAREHKGVAVDQFTIKTEQVPGAQPNPMMPQPPPKVTEIAAIDTLAAAASNNPDGGLLNGAIDRIKGEGTPGLDTSPAYKAALAAAPKGASMVGHMALNSLLAKYIEEIGKIQPAIAMLIGGVVKADPTEEPITGYAQFAEGHFQFATRIPHQPIVSLATRVRMLIQQQQKAMQPPGKAAGDDDF